MHADAYAHYLDALVTSVIIVQCNSYAIIAVLATGVVFKLYFAVGKLQI